MSGIIITTTDHKAFAEALFGPPDYALTRHKLEAAIQRTRCEMRQSRQRPRQDWLDRKGYATARAVWLSRLHLLRKLLAECNRREAVL